VLRVSRAGAGCRAHRQCEWPIWGGSAGNTPRATLAKWALEDIEDVEAFVATIARDVRANLQWWQRDDLHAYLLAECWILHGKWRRAATPSFYQYARYLLKLRVVDHVRQERGRTKWQRSGGIIYERERPELLSLDAFVGTGSPLRDALPDLASDPETDCASAVTWLLAERDSRRDRDYGELRRLFTGRIAIRASVNGQPRKIADWFPPEGMLERLQAAADENQRRLSAELTVAVEHYLDELERLEERECAHSTLCRLHGQQS
jgi:hypothetical protein